MRQARYPREMSPQALSPTVPPAISHSLSPFTQASRQALDTDDHQEDNSYFAADYEDLDDTMSRDELPKQSQACPASLEPPPVHLRHPTAPSGQCWATWRDRRLTGPPVRPRRMRQAW